MIKKPKPQGVTMDFSRLKDGVRMLLSFDNWFTAPNGQQYNSAVGLCKIIKSKDVLGFTPNDKTVDWMIQVGTGEKAMFAMGCRVHYAVLVETTDCVINPTMTYEAD